MTFIVPNPDNKKWSQTNASDLLGVVAQTKNIDFDRPGYLTLAKRSRAIYDANQDADFGHAVAISYWMRQLGTADEYYIVTNSGKGFIMDGSTFTMEQDTNTNVPTFDELGRSDLEVWDTKLYASAEDGLHRFIGNSFFPSGWISGTLGTAANGGGGPLCLFVNKNALAWGDGNTVKLYTGVYPSETLSVTLTLPTNYWVTSMAWSNNYLYIGTRNRGNGNAHLFQWDGADTTWNNSFSVGTHRIDSVTTYKDTVALITSDGQLLSFNGRSFDVLGNLPIYYTDEMWDVHGGGGATSARVPRVLHRGMVVEGDLIFINLSGQANISTNDNLGRSLTADFPSGIWCYDPEVGLYHRYALSGDLRLKTNAVTTGNVNLGTDVITVSGQTVPATGTPVLYDDGNGGLSTSLAPLEHREKYYVIYVSDTTMKLATTYANALAGTAIDLTGTGTDTQYFVFLRNRDFGGGMNSISGAVCLLKKGTDPGPVASDGRRLLFSGYAGETDTSLVSVLNVAAEGQENRGSVVTVKLLSSKITDDFHNITAKYKGVTTAEDAIVVKYRTIEPQTVLDFVDATGSQTGTWTDANTFTTTYDLSDVQVGDEVEVQRGSGAGYLLTIDSLSENAGTWTVNLTESVQNVTANDTMYFTVARWERIGEITVSDNAVFTNSNADNTTSEAGSKTIPFDKKGEWVQFKLELRGEDVAIYELLINNKTFREFTN